VAAEMLFAGRRLDAAEALRWGLVSRVVEPAQLLVAAHEVAQGMLAASPRALRGLVQFWRDQRARQDRVALVEERALFRSLIASTEMEAGIAAFAGRVRDDAS